MQLVWSQQAAHDLLSIGRYVSERNPRATRTLVGRIVDAATLLEDNLFAGRPGRHEGTRELVVSGTAYLVPYRQDRCEILAVFHAAREWPDTFDL